MFSSALKFLDWGVSSMGFLDIQVLVPRFLGLELLWPSYYWVRIPVKMILSDLIQIIFLFCLETDNMWLGFLYWWDVVCLGTMIHVSAYHWVIFRAMDRYRFETLGNPFWLRFLLLWRRTWQLHFHIKNYFILFLSWWLLCNFVFFVFLSFPAKNL